MRVIFQVVMLCCSTQQVVVSVTESVLVQPKHTPLRCLLLTVGQSSTGTALRALHICCTCRLYSALKLHFANLYRAQKRFRQKSRHTLFSNAFISICFYSHLSHVVSFEETVTKNGKAVRLFLFWFWQQFL